MRMTTRPQNQSKTQQHRLVHFGVETGPRLTATLALFLISFLALPINAQSAGSIGDHVTDVRFADRLHDRLNWQAGFEFPLFGDSITCPFESEADLAARIPQPIEESSDLEHEILRSICEIFHVDYCEAYASVWQPSVVAKRSNATESNLLRATDVVEWTNGVSRKSSQFGMWIQNGFNQVLVRSHDWVATVQQLESEFVAAKPGKASSKRTDASSKSFEGSLAFPFLIPPKYPTLGWPLPAFSNEAPKSPLLEAELFWEVFSSNLKSVGRKVEIHAANWLDRLSLNSSETINWLDSQLVATAEFAKSQWDQLLPMEQPTTIQPVPTASYVGLERAIIHVQGLVSKQFRQWQASGKLVALSSQQLLKLQNETFDRVVLKQFDAILR